MSNLHSMKIHIIGYFNINVMFEQNTAVNHIILAERWKPIRIKLARNFIIKLKKILKLTDCNENVDVRTSKRVRAKESIRV